MKRIFIAFVITACSCGLVLAGENLATNPSFEEPENGVGQIPDTWSFFTSKMNTMGLSDEAARTGVQSLKMTAQKAPDQYQGVHIILPVAESETYSFSAHLISNRDDRIGGTAHGMLVIEWKLDDGTEVSRTISDIWEARSLSRLRWEQIAIKKIDVPPGAVEAIFGIHISDGPKGGKGSIFVDDVVIERH